MMRKTHFCTLLVFSVSSAFIAGCLFSQIISLGSAHAQDLFDVEENEKIQVIFKEFLDEEKRLFRDPTFPPYGKEWELGRYRRYTGWLNRYLRTDENFYQEELDAIGEIEKIRRVKEQLSWSCSRQDEQYEVLIADLEKALIERVAVLEVFRFMNNRYSRDLRHPDTITIWVVELNDVSGSQVLPGNPYELFESRVTELSEELRNSF